VFDGGANGVEELALAGPAAALSGPAELTDLTVDRPTESYLLLSAVGDDATITVTAIVPEGGSVPGLAPSKQVVVPGGTTQVLPMSTFLPPASVAAFAVEVRPAVGSGPIYAARYLRTGGATGPLTTILALRSAAQEVQRPPVVTDLTVDRPR
jgi:hypothetical protein